MRLAFILGLLIGAFTQVARAQTAERPVVQAVRTTASVSVDGRLDEAVWASAMPVDAFTQVDPEEGQPVSEITEARVLFDDDALYVGVRLFDRDTPTARLGRRDMSLSDSDWVGLVIDSYHDHRTGFSFDLNPAGVQRDARKSMVGGRETDDLSWDGVWQGAASVDEEGWSAEYRIPFSQLRFSPEETMIWGIQIERVIGRRREYAVLSFTPKSEQGGIANYGHLHGLEGVRPGKRLEILPYSVARAQYVDQGGNPLRSDAEYRVDAGVDFLYRVTSDFTLNASVNPDFGQVEVDPAVVNLSVYETFFQEKRPFFIEGSEIFDFGRNTSGGQLFYSRRIGRRPQLGAPRSPSDAPDVSTILGAAKLSGKTASGWSIGVIESVTAREHARYLDGDAEARFEVEPLTNYFVARARRDLNQGRTSVGGMVTSVHRDLRTDALSDALRSSAFAGGLDFRMETPSRVWSVEGSGAVSRVAGSEASLARVQRAGNHFFQRPDAPHLSYDPTMTSLTGYSVGLGMARQAGEHWRGSLAAAATSPEFEINDLGFQTRTDRLDIQADVSYVENRPGTVLRNYTLSNSFRLEHNYNRELILGFWSGSASFRTLDFWMGFIRAMYLLPANDDRATRGGPLIRRPAGWSGLVHGGSDGRKPVVVFWTFGGSRDEFEGWTTNVNLNASVKMSDRWNLSVGPSWRRSGTQAQYVTTVADEAATQTYGAWYLFAPLTQTTVSLETRFDFTFTPHLSFQLYAQPFVSSGDYGEVGSLDEPGGYAFNTWTGDAPNLDFNFRSLRGTALLRWEWRPGSTLYFAWQQTRSDYDAGVGDFVFGRDHQALFRARPDNVFVLKANFWLNP